MVTQNVGLSDYNCLGWK